MYEHLYMGERAKKRRFSILQSLRRGTFHPGVHVITPPSNPSNVLDIYPAPVLRQPYYEKQDLLLLGIGADYYDALEAAGRIVSDMYHTTGGFCLETFLSARASGAKGRRRRKRAFKEAPRGRRETE